MIKRKHTKKLIVGIVLLCLVLAGIVIISCIWYPYRPTRQYTGCVISVRDDSLLLRFKIPDLDSKNFFKSLYWVNVSDAVFISNVDSIKTVNDLQPGMLVNTTIKNLDATNDLIAPSIPDMQTITQIETNGEIDDELFQAGIDDVYLYGFEYENGKVQSRMTLDQNYNLQMKSRNCR